MPSPRARTEATVPTKAWKDTGSRGWRLGTLWTACGSGSCSRDRCGECTPWAGGGPAAVRMRPRPGLGVALGFGRGAAAAQGEVWGGAGGGGAVCGGRGRQTQRGRQARPRRQPRCQAAGAKAPTGSWGLVGAPRPTHAGHPTYSLTSSKRPTDARGPTDVTCPLRRGPLLSPWTLPRSPKVLASPEVWWSEPRRQSHPRLSLADGETEAWGSRGSATGHTGPQ